MTYELRRETFLPRPIEEVFAFFSAPENLETLTPPCLGFQIQTPQPISMAPGAIIEYRLRVRGVPVRWRTRIETWDPPHEFSDVQEKGPYRLWRHTHGFRAVPGGTVVEDVVRYALPFGLLGRLVHWLLVRRDLNNIFDYRAVRLAELLGADRQPIHL